MRIREVCQLINGRAFKPSDWGTEGVPIVRIQNLNDVNATFNFFAGQYDPIHEINDGELLFSWSGTPGTSFGAFRWYRGIGVLNQHIFKVMPIIPIDKDYLMYALNGNLHAIISKAHGGVGLQHITKKELDEIEIPVPRIEIQLEIVSIIKRVEGVIAKRQRQIRTLDTLIKARFIEMFGDPETNPFGWVKTGLSDVVRGKASNGYFAKREEYVEDGNVSVLGVAYIVNRMYSQVTGLPRTNAREEDIQKHKVSYGDMLFCRSSLVAEGIGKASIVPKNTPANTLFECHVIRLPLNLDKCVPEFMQVLSTTDYFRKQIIAQSKTATMTTIGQDGILKTTIILPPIEKQQEFYLFVKQVDKSKAAVQQALEKAQLLFDSLMQTYFG